jgi:hypothetical protein
MQDELSIELRSLPNRRFVAVFRRTINSTGDHPMKLLVVSSIILFLASSVYPQQNPPTDSKPTQNTQQTLVAQAKMIAALAQQVAELERRIQILEQNEQHRSQVDSSTLSRPDFPAVKVALANYHQACLAEHDRAAAACTECPSPYLYGRCRDGLCGESQSHSRSGR